VDYAQALEYITRQGRFAVKLGLQRTQTILEHMGHPERLLQGIHVGGTNGKGSVAAMCTSILQQAGYRVGLMPKPHLIDYTERIQVDGQPISRDRFAALLTELEPLYTRLTEELGAPTEFELLTTAALYFYAHEAVDLLVCEVGLGGRLDATNVVDLGVEVITNVGFDHMQYLGTTLKEIATEKAAILKPGSLAATGAEGEALAVMERAAAEHGVPLLRLGAEVQVSASSRGWHGLEITVLTPAASYANLAVPLIGPHQAANAALAVAAIELLRARGWDLEPRHIRTGLARTRWPGRLDLLPGKPPLLVDAAHNQPALAAIVPAVRELLTAPDGRRRALAVVFGAMADKDLDAIFTELVQLPMEALIFTPIQYVRAATPAALLQRWRAVRPDLAMPVIAAPSLVEALARARTAAGPDGLVLACGSIYLVGEILAIPAVAPALSAR
jgi:dihydrofolate synthase/folylpolyglutamate synthase